MLKSNISRSEVQTPRFGAESGGPAPSSVRAIYRPLATLQHAPTHHPPPTFHPLISSSLNAFNDHIRTHTHTHTHAQIHTDGTIESDYFCHLFTVPPHCFYHSSRVSHRKTPSFSFLLHYSTSSPLNLRRQHAIFWYSFEILYDLQNVEQKQTSRGLSGIARVKNPFGILCRPLEIWGCGGDRKNAGVKRRSFEDSWHSSSIVETLLSSE